MTSIVHTIKNTKWLKNGVVATLCGVTVFLFWFLCYPQALSYQEQYQLFLWTADYLVDELKVAGGLAQYISEMLVQFYRIEWLGALILGMVYGCITAFMEKLLEYKWQFLSLVPSLLLLWHMGDENVMMAYPVSIIIALGCFFMFRGANLFVDFLILPLLFWLIGPLFWLYALLRFIPLYDKYNRGVVGLAMLYVLLVQVLSHYLILQQWPISSVLCGIWYYRYAVTFPVLQFVIPLVIYGIYVLSLIVKELNGRLWCGYIWNGLSACIVIVLGWFGITNGYDKDKYELINQDYLIRNEQWGKVIERAERYTVKTPFWSESVNLSLAMTGQLAQRQFAFYQSGEDALIMSMCRDMTSNLPSMEAFFRLGMTNECLRYAFDLQESIPYGKRSGRLTKRIVECCIVSGRYDVARKHNDMLMKSLFYRDWAMEIDKLIRAESLIDSHPIYGVMRKKEFKDDFLYFYPDLDKVFYRLFVSNTDNRLAMEYMIAQLLLSGNAHVFMQVVGVATQYGHYSSIPYTYQDALQCMQGYGVVGSRYDDYVQMMQSNTYSQPSRLTEENSH